MMTLRSEGFNKALALANRQLTQFARKAEEAGRTMTMAFSLPTAAIGGAAISAFAEMDKLRKSLTAVAGSSEEAEKQLDRLRTLALEPGLDLEQATRAVIRLQSVGYAASEAERTILQMSKAVTLAGGTADDLDEVIRQMTQMEGRGTILREDWNVIAERVPAINIALQDAFGTTNIEAIRNTGISVKDFNQAIVQAISENEKFQSVQGGVANAITNFQSSIRQSLGVLGEAIDKNINITAVLDKLSGFINRVAKGFADMDPRLQSVILGTAAFLAALGPVLLAFGSVARLLPTITLGLQAMGATFGAILSPIGLTVAAIVAVAVGIAKAYKENEVLRNSLQALGAQFGELWRAIDSIMQKILRAFLGLIGETDKFKGTWQTLFAVFTGIINAIVGRLTGLVGVVTSIVKAINFALDGEFRKMDGAFGEALKALVDTVNPMQIGKDFMDAFNEGIKQTDIELPKPKVTAPRPDTVPGTAIPIAEGTGVRRPTVQPLAELPSLANQIIEANKLALANDAVRISNESVARSFDEVTESMSRAMPQFERVNQLTFEMPSLISIFSDVTNKITDSFVNLAEQGSASLADFARAAIKSIRQVIGEVIRLGVATAIEKALNNAAIAINPLLIPVIAGAAGALAKTAFNSILNTIKVPALAEGGLAYGPTMAMVGDNPGARSNPEVIAPLSKLESILAGSQGMAMGEFVLRGEDLLLSVTRSQNRQNRFK